MPGKSFRKYQKPSAQAKPGFWQEIKVRTTLHLHLGLAKFQAASFWPRATQASANCWPKRGLTSLPHVIPPAASRLICRGVPLREEEGELIRRAGSSLQAQEFLHWDGQERWHEEEHNKINHEKRKRKKESATPNIKGSTICTNNMYKQHEVFSTRLDIVQGQSSNMIHQRQSQIIKTHKALQHSPKITAEMSVQQCGRPNRQVVRMLSSRPFAPHRSQ